MMASPPPVSVYMPAFNVERYVADAVRSILSQTFSDFELIVVDDGSTDRTLDILRDLARTDPRIKLLSRPNTGVSRASNEAIALARGQFLARMDSDDFSMPDRLEKQIAWFGDHPECVCVGANVLLMDQVAMPLFVMPEIEFGHRKIDNALMAGGWPIVQGACMYRREAVVAAGGYREDLSLHEDMDMFVRLAERGQLENLPDVLLKYRRHYTSITFRESGESEGIVIGILREARERRGLPEPKEPGTKPNGRVPANIEILRRCRHWAWMSLKARHVATARKYAWAGLRRAPLSSHSWRLMYCALRGR